MAGTNDRLRQLIAGHLGAEGVELYDLELVGQGKGRVLRVMVEAEGGIDLDRITDVSHGVSRLLDEEDAIGGTYSLEVTSPGLERPLRTPAHYAAAVGREVEVKVEAAGPLRGVLTQADGTGLTVEVDGEGHHVAYDEVRSARTVFRWERGEKPGGKKKTTKTKKR